MKPKYETQSAHFLEKLFRLHCGIAEPEEMKCEYHLSDDTTHDFVFAQKVLEVFFVDRGVKDMTAMIKNDNAPTHYKNKYDFD